MKKAVIYARYSCEQQTEQSIEGQLRVCEEYAQRNNILILDTYIDRAMTGTNDNRAAFQQMLADCEKPVNWEIVLVYAIDRFGRNSIEIAVNKQRLKKNHKTLISATQRTSENIDGTKNLDGILLENVYIGIAEYYSAELSQKVLRGLNENRKKGLFCGGIIPYGYKVQDKKIYIVDEQAEIVRYMFEQYALGTSVPKIIAELNKKGIVKKGRQFTSNCIYGILKNEKYIGISRTKTGVYENTYPKIVPLETFEKVQQRVALNKFGKGGVADVYLFKHKIRCGYCGSTISADCGTNSKGHPVRYYACRGKKKLKNGCKKSAIRKEALEKFVMEVIITSLTEEQTMNKLIDRIMAIQEQQGGESPALKVMRKERKQAETALNNLLGAIEQGIYSATTNKRLHDLEEQLNELEKGIAIEESKSILQLTREEVREYYKQALELEPQLLVNYLVDDITLFDDKVIIKYKTPISTSPDESQGFSYYVEKYAEMAVKPNNRNTPIYKTYKVQIGI